MVKSSRNQLANATSNPYQGDAKKVLCVCSAGMLRSPTMANVLHAEYGYNTRSCGIEAEFALIPMSEALYEWADEIVFASQAHFDKLLDWVVPDDGKKFIVLHIPDEYEYGDPNLVQEIRQKYYTADYV